MKKINFNIVLKIFILLASAYFLYVLTQIAGNLENGRYQFKTYSRYILDTKTGKIYYNENGRLIEKK